MSSKVLSVASVIEKNRLSSDVPFLICLDIEVVNPTTGMTVETRRVVRNTEDIVYRGNTYTAADFDIQLKQEAGTQQSVSLSMKDYSSAIMALMQSYGGGIGFKVTVMVVNAGNLVQPPEVSEYFEVIAASAANYVVSFTLGAESALAKVFPRRRQTRDFCQWRYKGAECGYTGALASCDLTLNGSNGCQAHNNVIRFGGFPGLNQRDVRYG